MTVTDDAPTPDAALVPPPPGRCPVCQARFRASPICSRCGTDLAPLMRVAARAHAARAAGRAALARGDLPIALQWIALADQLQAPARP